MKKNILIASTICLAASLTAYGLISGSDKKENAKITVEDKTPDQGKTAAKDKGFEFIYAIESRFTNSLTEERVHNASSIEDLIPNYEEDSILTYHDIEVTKYELSCTRSSECPPTALDGTLNDAQKTFLQTLNCTSNFSLIGKVKRQKKGTSETYFDPFTYYISVVPESPATYKEGNESLVRYLKEESKKEIEKVKRDKIKPGKIELTVSKEGQLENVMINSSCGYEKVDAKMLELIEELPGKWTPAVNASGEKVDQQLVFFFGLQGC